jgi:hypothetical protein
MSREVDERPREWLVKSAQRMRRRRLRYATTSFSAFTNSTSASDAHGSAGVCPAKVRQPEALTFSLAHDLHHRPLSGFFKEV